MTAISVTTVKASTDGSTDYGFNQLNSSQKQYYTAIKDAVNSFISSDHYNSDYTSTNKYIITLQFDIAENPDDLIHAYEVFYYDNPQYYWLSRSISTTRSLTKMELRLSLDSQYYRASARQTADSVIADISTRWTNELSDLLDDLPGDEDKYEVALALHDLIIDKIDYLYVNGSPSLNRSAHSIVGVLDGSGAVCEGYARAYQYILNLLDIENVYITGHSRSEGHAWNAVKLDGEYYCVDVTWDDGNNSSYLKQYDNRTYDYFCTPISVFSMDHRTDTGIYSYPAFAGDTGYSYYHKFQSIATGELNAATAETFISNALANGRGDYVYFQVPSQDSLQVLIKTMGLTGSYNALKSVYGYLYVFENIVINNPAESLELRLKEDISPLEDNAEISIELQDSISFDAIMAAAEGECDDRIAWTISGYNTIATLNTKDTACTINAKRNGTLTLTATTYKGTDTEGQKLRKNIKIICGTGIYSPLYTIFAGGNKETKNITLKPALRASSWKDSKGKIKPGKIVWVILEEQTSISFDEEKHKVTTKSVKNLATVNGKGVVSAKKPGIVYVYCCDTGSMTWECFDIQILSAPSKLLISSVAGSSSKNDLLKNTYIEADSIGQAFIIPIFKDNGTETCNNYFITYSKPSDNKYLRFTQPETDSSGNTGFMITGLDFDRTKKKPASVKLVITNAQSGKKTNLTVNVTNPVKSLQCDLSGYSLAKKDDTVTVRLHCRTALGSDIATTDSAKVYIAGTSVSINGNKIVSEGKTTVKAKYDKKTDTITLKASKDAGSPAEVYMLYTAACSKARFLVHVCSVDESGNVRVATE